MHEYHAQLNEKSLLRDYVTRHMENDATQRSIEISANPSA